MRVQQNRRQTSLTYLGIIVQMPTLGVAQEAGTLAWVLW